MTYLYFYQNSLHMSDVIVQSAGTVSTKGRPPKRLRIKKSLRVDFECSWLIPYVDEGRNPAVPETWSKFLLHGLFIPHIVGARISSSTCSLDMQDDVQVTLHEQPPRTPKEPGVVLKRHKTYTKARPLRVSLDHLQWSYHPISSTTRHR